MADITYTKPTWANGQDPALSAANAQALSDAVDAVAHKANRGAAVLEADTVPGAGIGVSGLPSNPTIDANDYIKGGIFGTNGSWTNDPFPGSQEASVLVLPLSATKLIQVAFATSTAGWVKSRTLNGTTWTAWKDGINYYWEGNSGQPPVGKGLLVQTGVLAQNAYVSITLTAGCSYLVHVQNATIGGTTAVIAYHYSGAAAISTLLAVGTVSVVASGNDIRLTNLNASNSVLKYHIVQIGN